MIQRSCFDLPNHVLKNILWWRVVSNHDYYHFKKNNDINSIRHFHENRFSPSFNTNLSKSTVVTFLSKLTGYPLYQSHWTWHFARTFTLIWILKILFFLDYFRLHTLDDGFLQSVHGLLHRKKFPFRSCALSKREYPKCHTILFQCNDM